MHSHHELLVLLVCLLVKFGKFFNLDFETPKFNWKENIIFNPTLDNASNLTPVKKIKKELPLPLNKIECMAKYQRLEQWQENRNQDKSYLFYNSSQ